MTTPSLAPLLDQLAALIADSDRMTREWTARGAFSESDLAAYALAGEPDAVALETFKSEFEETASRPVLHALAATLTRFNGIAVFEADPSDEAHVSTAPADEVDETDHLALYPSVTDHDRWLFNETELFEDEGTPIVIGQIADSGWFVLVVPSEGEAGDVYWVDRSFSKVPPVKIATSLDGYLLMLLDAALSLPLVLKAAKIQGWGA